MSKMKEYIYEKEKEDMEKLEVGYKERECFVCGGTGVIADRVFDFDTKELIPNGEKLCICQDEPEESNDQI